MSERTGICYFWIAFYRDGTCLPQYDLDTGEQHLFKEIDQSKLEKFGWFPFSQELVAKINNSACVANSSLPYYIIRLKPNQRLIALRRESQKFFTYSRCLKCGFEWQWIPKKAPSFEEWIKQKRNSQNVDLKAEYEKFVKCLGDITDGSIGDAGLPRYGEKYSYFESHPQDANKRLYEVICPKCGAKNDLKCPNCHEWWNKVVDEETKNESLEKQTYHLECPNCKAKYEQRTETLAGHFTENIFLLGWQETLPDDKTRKMIMFIKQDGTFTLDDNFDFGDK